MSPAKITVELDKLGDKLKAILVKAGKDNRKEIAGEMVRFPIRAQTEAVRFYPSVLNRVSGDLVRSIEGFDRIEGTNFISGLRNKMDYARYQEYGTKHLKATKFMSTPLGTEAKKLVSILKRRVGFHG